MAGKRQSITRGEWIMLLIVGGFTALMLTATCWLNYINAAPKITLPPEPPMPNPNAYNFYQRAARTMIGRTYQDIYDEIIQWDWPAPPPSRRPKHRIVGYTRLKTGRTVPRYMATPPPTLAAAERALRKNAPSLSLIRQGFAFPCHAKPDSNNTAEELKKLLMVAERTYAARGRWADDMDSYLDIDHLGVDLLQGQTVEALDHFHDDQLWRKPAWTILPHLNAQEARTAAKRLHGITAARPAFVDMVRESRRQGLLRMVDTFRASDWRFGHSFPLEVFAVPMRRIAEDNIRVLDRLVACAEGPYARHAPIPAQPGGYIDVTSATYLIANFGSYRLHYTNDVAQDGLLLVALAVQAYRQEHGAYPQRLEQLCPAYLNALPADPFALHGAFRYRLKGNSYLLYSLGPDGKDDNGAPVMLKFPLDKDYKLYENSTGDTVAGVNLGTQ